MRWVPNELADARKKYASFADASRDIDRFNPPTSAAGRRQMIMDLVQPRNEEGEIMDGLITAGQAAEIMMEEMDARPIACEEVDPSRVFAAMNGRPVAPCKNGVQLDEESPSFKDLKELWEDRAKLSTETFEEFFSYLQSFKHDYGTTVWAASMVMRKAFYLWNRSEEGGITGFQASCLAWDMMDFFGMKDPVGMRLMGYSELCFPEREGHFCEIPYEIWEMVRKFADEQIKDHGDSMLASHRSHMIDVRDGKVPFGLRVGKKPEEVKSE